jgi:hypothetical protein
MAQIITENFLDSWVRGNAEKAQGLIVELVWRLVAAAVPKPKERDFPLPDSIGQPGPDGILDTDFSFDPFVPEGKSFWEIGTGEKPGDKATSDYKSLTSEPTTAIDLAVRNNSTFIFITPLSGRKGWQKPAQSKWLKARRKLMHFICDRTKGSLTAARARGRLEGKPRIMDLL